MEYQDVLNYVDNYLRKLAPFKDNKVYQSFVNLLRNQFFKHGYQDIPLELKQYVENQIIDPKLYDVFLIGIGYPVYLVKSLRLTQKKNIIDGLMDYPMHSGTLKHLLKICSVMNENFNVYELYADYKAIFGPSGQLSMEWLMVPRIIYASNEHIPASYDYEAVYNDTPTYFVSKEYLELQKSSGNLSLPFKTNLIVLDMKNVTYENDIQQIKSIAVYNHFKNYQISLFLQKNTYVVSIEDVYRLWYYIIFVLQGEIKNSSFNALKSIYFNISDDEFPYVLEESAVNSIVKLEEEYDQLPNSRDAIIAFYNKYIKSELEKPVEINQYTLADYRKQMIISLGIELISEIEDIIGGFSNPYSDGVLIALGLLEDSLNYYLISSPDPLALKYQNDLLLLFSKLLIEAEKTATYKMILEFKPFHTQLIAYSKHQLSNKSKLNNTFIDSEERYVIHDYPHSAKVISDDYKLSMSIETGYYEFTKSTNIKTDIAGASSFIIGDDIYARDISTNIFKTENAQEIINIYGIGGGVYIIELKNVFEGPYGTFPRAYKYIYTSMVIHEEIKVSDDSFFSFTNVFDANEVHTTLEGFVRFAVGDFIYSIVDQLNDAVEIIAKDADTYSFILKENYKGTSGTWQSAMRYKPAS